MLIRTHIGVSLDGFMAGPDGMPAWGSAPDFHPSHGESHGYPEFIEQCEAVVIGRTTLEQRLGNEWPWPGRPVFVLTSRPLPANVPAGVTASEGGPAGLVEQLRNAGLKNDAQLLGGAQTIQAFLEINAIDQLGICVLPVLLGGGTPLWASGAAPKTLRLERQRAFPDGAVQLVYSQT